MNEQLRIDLRKQIYRKLRQWVDDSVNLYDMVEISEQDAMQDVLTLLTSISALIVVDSTMGIGEYARIHASALKHLRENTSLTEEDTL